MIDDLKDVFIVVLACAAFVMTATALISVPYGFIITKRECDIKAASFEAHEFHFIGGCMVFYNDKWLPIENVMEFQK